jgi:hypothetical protein
LIESQRISRGDGQERLNGGAKIDKSVKWLDDPTRVTARFNPLFPQPAPALQLNNQTDNQADDKR